MINYAKVHTNVYSKRKRGRFTLTRNGIVSTDQESSEAPASLNKWSIAHTLVIAIARVVKETTVPDLIAYQCYIMSMAETHTWERIAKYDVMHRRKVAQVGARLAQVDQHLWTMVLGRETNSREVGAGPPRQSERKPRVKSNQPCRQWNRQQRCARNPCRFAHYCSWCYKTGDRANHPEKSCVAKTKMLTYRNTKSNSAGAERK